MESVMETLTIVVLVIIIVAMFAHIVANKQIFLNSNNKGLDDRNFPVKFYIESIEKSSDKGGNRIAKYTITNYFFALKNNRDWHHNTLYFYDKVDAYQLGDVLTLTKENYTKAK